MLTNWPNEVDFKMQWYERKEIVSPVTITAGIDETRTINNLKIIRNWEIDHLIRYSVALLQDDAAANFLCNSYNSEQLVIISGLSGMSFPLAHLAKILSVKWKTIYFMIHFSHSLLQKDTESLVMMSDDVWGLMMVWTKCGKFRLNCHWPADPKHFFISDAA